MYEPEFPDSAPTSDLFYKEVRKKNRALFSKREGKASTTRRPRILVLRCEDYRVEERICCLTSPYRVDKEALDHARLPGE